MIYTQEFGEATKGHVILVHGLGEHFRRHYRLIKRLKDEGFKVHAFDWPGHGKSLGKRGHARIEETLEIIDKMIKDIEDKPFLFGHSLGGLTVLRYAEENPEKVKGIVASSPALESGEDISTIAEKMISFLSYLFPKKTLSDSIDIDKVTRSGKALKKYEEDDLVQNEISFALARDLFHNMKKAHEEKKKLNVPSLILVGTEDEITPMVGGEKFVTGLENVKLKKFEGAFHEIFNDPEHKEEFHQIILSWLKDQS
ncbi:MAG: alpha/beta hydrolase [Candidatus Natronoplasma sp.]